MNTQPTILDKILVKKRAEVAEMLQNAGRQEYKARLRDAGPVRDFAAALRDCPRTPIIAEIKKASPSKGKINLDVDIPGQAASYEAGGAAALSVLTDGPFFNGHIRDLTQAREAVSIPVLRKDFIIDPVQLYEARSAGADAVLLIAAALDPVRLSELFHEALELGMTPLVEVHQDSELPSVLALNPPVVGINNRNLATLEVSLDTGLNLRPLIGSETLVVGESGITGPADVARLLAGGLNAFLVGTLLMEAADPKAMLAGLCRTGNGRRP